LALKNSLEFTGVRSTLEKKSIEVSLIILFTIVIFYSCVILFYIYFHNFQSILKILHYENIEKTHIDIWEKLWSTGFSISMSKASGVLNGDLINATVYSVLSSVRAPSYEITSSPAVLAKVSSSLSYVEGCYGANHDTLYVYFVFCKINKIKYYSLIVIILDKL